MFLRERHINSFIEKVPMLLRTPSIRLRENLFYWDPPGVLLHPTSSWPQA